MEQRSILLLGMEESNVLADCLRRTGRVISQSPVVDDGMDLLDDAGLGVVYLHPSSHAQALAELRRILARRPDLAVVLVCSGDPEKLTLDAWRTGAVDIVFPPFTPDAVEESLQRASRRSRRPQAEARPL